MGLIDIDRSDASSAAESLLDVVGMRLRVMPGDGRDWPL